MAVNPFLSTIVRIQDDRGHYVVTSGPYRYVRHPMYAMMFFMWPGIALLLGSWWALMPALVIIIVFVIRTALEDKTLQATARLCRIRAAHAVSVGAGHLVGTRAYTNQLRSLNRISHCEVIMKKPTLSPFC